LETIGKGPFGEVYLIYDTKYGYEREMACIKEAKVLKKKQKNCFWEKSH